MNNFCDGGDDLHGGTVPDLTNKFIMGVTQNQSERLQFENCNMNDW